MQSSTEGRQEDEKQIANWPSTKNQLIFQESQRLTESGPDISKVNSGQPVLWAGPGVIFGPNQTDTCFLSVLVVLVLYLVTVTKFIEVYQHL